MIRIKESMAQISNLQEEIIRLKNQLTEAKASLEADALLKKKLSLLASEQKKKMEKKDSENRELSERIKALERQIALRNASAVSTTTLASDESNALPAISSVSNVSHDVDLVNVLPEKEKPMETSISTTSFLPPPPVVVVPVEESSALSTGDSFSNRKRSLPELSSSLNDAGHGDNNLLLWKETSLQSSMSTPITPIIYSTSSEESVTKKSISNGTETISTSPTVPEEVARIPDSGEQPLKRVRFLEENSGKVSVNTVMQVEEEETFGSEMIPETSARTRPFTRKTPKEIEVPVGITIDTSDPTKSGSNNSSNSSDLTESSNGSSFTFSNPLQSPRPSPLRSSNLGPTARSMEMRTAGIRGGRGSFDVGARLSRIQRPLAMRSSSMQSTTMSTTSTLSSTPMALLQSSPEIASVSSSLSPMNSATVSVQSEISSYSESTSPSNPSVLHK